jgi:anti-sigma B factor antagonist
MKISEKIDGDFAILKLTGDLISEPDASDIRNKLHSLVSDNIKKVIIDLGDISYINSLGLGALITARSTMINANGQLKLARIGKKIESLLVMVGLVRLFDIYENVDRAVGSFSSKKK